MRLFIVTLLSSLVMAQGTINRAHAARAGQPARPSTAATAAKPNAARQVAHANKQVQRRADGRLLISSTTYDNGTTVEKRFFKEPGEPVSKGTVTTSWTLKSGVQKRSYTWHGKPNGKTVLTRLTNGIERVDYKGNGGKRDMFVQVQTSVVDRSAALTQFAAQQTKPFTAFVYDADMTYRAGVDQGGQVSHMIEISPGDSQRVIDRKIAGARLRGLGLNFNYSARGAARVVVDFVRAWLR